MFPLSAVSAPAIILRSVDFPVPFIPITPILSPASIPNVIFSNTYYSPKIFVRPSTVNKFMLFSPILNENIIKEYSKNQLFAII